MNKEEATEALWQALEDGNLEALKGAIAAGADVNAKSPELGDTPLSLAEYYDLDECVELLIDAGAKGPDDDDEYEEEEEEEEEDSPVWEGRIYRSCEYKGCYPGRLPELLNVGEKDRLMFVRVEVSDSSNEWGMGDEEYIGIYLKRDGGEWASVCWPDAPKDANPYFPENWDMEEILDAVWDWETVTYATKLNEDYEQIEATWALE